MLRVDLTNTLNCRMVGRARQKRGWEHQGRKNDKWNLFVFIIDGEAEFHFSRQTFIVKPGDVVIIPKHTMYTAWTADSCEYFFVSFGSDLGKCDTMPVLTYERRPYSFVLQPVQFSCVYLNEYIQTGERKPEFYSRISECVSRTSDVSHSSRMLVNVEFERILLLLGGICERDQLEQKLPQTLDRIMQYVHKNLGQSLTVSMICEHFGLSHSYLARLFKQYLKMTPTAYINNEKMHYAAELLQNTNMNISEIAEYLGYCDVFYFSRLYKRTFGVPPSRDIKR